MKLDRHYGPRKGKLTMSLFTKEMQRALEVDGEKLRAMTGEDHGPFVCQECEEPLPLYRGGMCKDCWEWMQIAEAHKDDPSPSSDGVSEDK